MFQMNQYKPEYLGRIIPADDESKLTNFVQNKFEGFDEIYNACKNYSDQISDITNISNNSINELSVKIICSAEIIEKIEKNNPNINVNLDIITAHV